MMLRALPISALETSFSSVDRRITASLACLALPALRLGLGVVFVWFGLLKMLGSSPATELVVSTTAWMADPGWFVPFLGVWEVLIGVCLIDPIRLLGGSAWMTRLGILLLALQIPGTFLPLVMVPEACFTGELLGLTIEGQYVIKNLVLIAAAIALGATVRDRVRSPGRSPAQ